MLMAAGEPEAAVQSVDLFVAVAAADRSRDAWRLSRDARRAGLTAQVELAGRSLKGQLRHAGRIGARYSAIVGEDAQVTLRDMESGEQRELGLAQVIDAVRGS
jgi:histidyl-tRNA synthetase